MHAWKCLRAVTSGMSTLRGRGGTPGSRVVQTRETVRRRAKLSV